MLAYKGFKPGLVCLGYQFAMGLNVTDKANCRPTDFIAQRTLWIACPIIQI